MYCQRIIRCSKLPNRNSQRTQKWKWPLQGLTKTRVTLCWIKIFQSGFCISFSMKPTTALWRNLKFAPNRQMVPFLITGLICYPNNIKTHIGNSRLCFFITMNCKYTHRIPQDQTCLFKRVSMRTSEVPICFSTNFLISLIAFGARRLNPLYKAQGISYF